MWAAGGRTLGAWCRALQVAGPRRGVSWAPPPSVSPGRSRVASFMGLRATPGSLPCWASALPTPRTGLSPVSGPPRGHGPAPGLTAWAHTQKLTSDSRAGAWRPEQGWTPGEGVDADLLLPRGLPWVFALACPPQTALGAPVLQLRSHPPPGLAGQGAGSPRPAESLWAGRLPRGTGGWTDGRPCTHRRPGTAEGLGGGFTPSGFHPEATKATRGSRMGSNEIQFGV